MRSPIFTVLALVLASVAGAHEYKLGTLNIDHPVIRVASPVSKTGAGFMTISNRGTQADRLVSITTDASNRADLHGTIAKGNVMQMRAQSGGVAIPAGSTVAFAPGGLHVMFIGLKAPVPAGRMLKARLIFERAGAVDVMFKAEAAGQAHQH